MRSMICMGARRFGAAAGPEEAKARGSKKRWFVTAPPGALEAGDRHPCDELATLPYGWKGPAPDSWFVQ